MINDIKAIDQVLTDQYALYHGDACELIRAVPNDSVDFGVHSPPFEGLYKFSANDRDISNNEGGAFWEHYGFLIGELLRVTKPGRLHSVHVMQLPTSKTRDGQIGVRDFRGDVIRAYQAAGWIFHSEVCIWKDPVVAQQRTKSIRLLHKQLTKDSTISGQGLADYVVNFVKPTAELTSADAVASYVVSFRKPGDNAEPVAGFLDQWVGDDSVDVSPERHAREDAERAAEGRAAWPFDTWRSILVWQRYASPVWADIRQTRTLQYRSARDEKDEQHISPLQLDVIERCVALWSNPGDVVLTPFAGIGSEVYAAVEMGRFGVGFELKASYFRQAVRNLADLGAIAEDQIDDMLS